MASTPLSARWRTAAVAAACAVLALLPFARANTATPDGGDEKLTTVLKDLAQAVPQQEGPVANERTGTARLVTDELPASVQNAMQSRRLRLNERNAVQVYVLLQEVNDGVLSDLRAEGAAIEIVDAAHLRVQARIPVNRLRAVADLPFVNFVRLPTYAVHRAGSFTTEGDAIHRANVARQVYGLDGTGIKVGALSDGLKGVFATNCTNCNGASGGPITTGDLPSATGTRTLVPLPLPAHYVLNTSSGGIVGKSFQANNDLEGIPSGGCPGFAGAGAEGTALLEIIHDLAPNAQLAFANADTDLAFQQAVNYLAANNDVVVDDLGFYGEAYDGTSAVSTNTANALNNNSNRIRAYVTSGGNAADEHYIGTYADSGVDGTSITGITKSGHLHLFQQTADTTDVLNRGSQPYNLIQLPAGGEVVIFLTWDDRFGASGNNYDLYLVRESSGAVVAKSTDAQTGTQDPLEAFDYVNNGGLDYFHIVVQNVNSAAQPRQLNLFSFEPECATSGPRLLSNSGHERHNYNTATRSVAAQSDAGGSPVSVISAGAICSASASAASATGGRDESCNDPTNSTIEFFSSRGPTIDGRQKPDVSGIDGVTISGAGSFPSPFFGTSAAAPHVAGIAALLLQAAPCLVSGASGAADPVTARTNLRNLIVGNAVRLGDANTFGSGRADALNSVQKTLPVLSGPATVTVPGGLATGASLTAAQLGFTDPNSCALTRVTATGGCTTQPGGTITCPFGTTNTSVSASNNGVSFSPVANMQVNVTNFSVSGSPVSATVNAGQSVAYLATVAAQGGPFGAPVTLGCSNLPAQSTCSFSPATVTPGSGSIQTTVTISTTARPQTSQVRRRQIAALPAARAPRSPSLPMVLALTGLAVSAVLISRSRQPGRSCRSFLRAKAGRLFEGAKAGTVSLAWPAAVLVAVTFGPVFNQSSCGSSSGPTGPAVTLSSSSLTFATQNLQTTSAAQTVTLTNSGKSALTINGITATGEFAQTNTCGTSLAAGANCSIAVTFTPLSTGARTGSISINDNAPGSPHTVALGGTGQANGTPAGSYQVNITGTSGTNVQTGTVTLVVR